MDELKVFTGNANPALAQAIVEYLKIPLGKCEVFQFSNENTFVRILENVRERDVFVVQPFCTPVNSNLVEMLIMLDAFKRATAGRITAVVPYYGYGRTDKRPAGCRLPLIGRDLITTAGANRILVDLRAPDSGFQYSVMN
jgi:ribose-phosphate pyrophosphokinase